MARELDTPVGLRGHRLTIVRDSGSELTSMAVLRRSQWSRIDRRYIALGKPTQNVFIESFNADVETSF